MPPPRGGGALLRNLSDKNGLFSASNTSENLTPQEQLLNGTLELDPENDPVICTTESGIEIKYTTASINNNYYGPNMGGVSTSPSVLSGTGYAYLKMGNYNWIIIGYNTSSTTATVTWSGNFALAFSTYLANPTAYQSFAGSLEKSSDAGGIIYNNAGKGLIWNPHALSIALNYSLAVKNTSDLASGEVLLMTQDLLDITSKCTPGPSDATKSQRSYDGSENQTAHRNLYYPSTGKNDAGFTESEKKLIVAKSLKSGYGLDSEKIKTHTEYLFPFAYEETESFRYWTYLSNEKNKMGVSYGWFRTIDYSQYYGNYGYHFWQNGGTNRSSSLSLSYPMRPLMVIKI